MGDWAESYPMCRAWGGGHSSPINCTLREGHGGHHYDEQKSAVFTLDSGGRVRWIRGRLGTHKRREEAS